MEYYTVRGWSSWAEAIHTGEAEAEWWPN